MSQRTEADKGKYVTDVFAREAVGFLQRYLGKQPVFLYLAFNAPHSASSFPDAEGKRPGVQAPEEYVAQYRGLAKTDALARYFAAVTCMDAAIGRVLQTLDDASQAENTLVIFLSDNGGSGNGGNAPLRGAKATMWEGGLRVPFLFRWPARVPPGRVTDEFLTALEILPTLLAATGAAAPTDLQLDGFDLLPVVRGERPSPRAEMFWQRRGDKAARCGNWKWIESADGGGLFDLAADPGETTDLSAREPETARRLRERFAAWRREMDATPPRGPFRDY